MACTDQVELKVTNDLSDLKVFGFSASPKPRSFTEYRMETEIRAGGY
jgi:hypothetical protein